MNGSTPISLSNRRPYSLVLVALVPAVLIGALIAILMGAPAWLPLALACGLAVLIVIAAEPVRLVYLVPILVAIEYRIRINVGSVTIAELSAVLVGIVLCLRMVRGQAARWPGYQREVMLVGLVALAALPSMWFLENLRTAASSYRDLLLPLLFYLAFRAANLERRHILNMVRLFVVFATVGAALGIAQYLSGQFLYFQSEGDALWQTYKIYGARGSILANWLGLGDTLAMGLFSGVNNFATYLLIPCSVGLAWAMSPTTPRKVRLFWLGCAVLQIVALLFTFFRTGLLTLGMSAWFIAWFRKRRITRGGTMFVGIGVLGALVLVLGTEMLAWDQFATVEGRGSMVRDALDLIARHPMSLFTGGYNELYYARYDQIQAIHNIALYLFVRFGMPTALALLVFYLGAVRDSYRVASDFSGADRTLALGILAGTAGILFFLAQTTSFLDAVQNSMWLLFWLAAGGYLYAFRNSSPAPADSFLGPIRRR